MTGVPPDWEAIRRSREAAAARVRFDLEAIKAEWTPIHREHPVWLLVAEVERLRWMETELTQAVRLANQEADGIQAELQAEVERLRAEMRDQELEDDHLRNRVFDLECDR